MTRTHRGSSRRQAPRVEGLESRDLMSGETFVEFNFPNNPGGSSTPLYEIADVQVAPAAHPWDNNYLTFETTIRLPLLTGGGSRNTVNVVVDGANGRPLLLETFSGAVEYSLGPAPSTPQSGNHFTDLPTVYKFTFTYQSVSYKYL